ncbi:insulinase family protein [Euhalothece natronophila Z-M001]|uniref:Insulinase family protein n=1 Tax=Euhalothece natronophila Z-M001 TaxID=522448 RepID=A0A5B8NNX4_9CHRO|nr:pitrilysin family protein [Euhalothece natronophila]QDZ40768.1 insulinase family protein [Euhalothece natronophila Z-M001]
MKQLKWLMIAIFVSLFVIICNSDLFANAASKEPKHYTDLEFSPPPEIRLPDYTTTQLDNGLTLYLIEDHDFPLVTGTAIFRTGSRLEPADKVGLASLTGSLMRQGGTENYSPNELNQILEQRAASIETSINTTSGSAEFDCLTGDLDQVFDLFAEVIKSPAFDEQQFALAKQQAEGRISRRDDDPGDVADREFKKLVYGEDSPYARTEEYETLDNISREDVIAFYESYFRPEEMILGIVGDFDSEEMRDRAQEAFGNWEVTTPTPNYELADVEQATTGGVHLVEKPQLSQSYVEMGHLAGTLDNPDYPTLRVINGALNGFGGTLYNEVRSRQGLAYSVYGVWRANYDYPGYFVAGGQTSSETTVPFIQSIQNEITKVQEDLLSEDQLAYAKESILNSFIFNFESNEQTLSRLMRYNYYDYPDDFIFQLQEGIRETSKEDVQRVAQTYLKPEEMTTLIVGNPDGIDPSLEELGQPVTHKSIN